MKKVLITGSNGLLGQKLVALMAGQPGYEIIATSRGNNRLPFSAGYRYCSMDITSAEETEAVISTEKPDVIIHTAAMTHVDQCEADKEGCWSQNVYAVGLLAEICARLDIFLLHLSTDFIFDGANGPYKETDEANPVSFYGWSKLAAERLVLHSKARHAIARTVLVYGIAHDMSRSNIILWVRDALKKGQAIKVVTDQWRTPTLAEDLAKGCMLIAENEAEGIFHLSGKDFLTPYEMALEAAAYFGLDDSLITPVDASTFTQPGKRPPKTGFIIDKAVDTLGYTPVSFKEGIAFLASQVERPY